MRDDLQQEIGAGETPGLLVDVEFLVLVAHRAGGDAHLAVVERAEEVVGVHVQRGRREFLREAPQFAAAGDRRVIVEIHRERIAARLAVVFDGNHLAAFGVVAKAGRIGHADEFVMHERLGDLQRLGDDFAETVRIGAIRDDQELTIDETVRAHREGGAGQRHRKRFRSDIAGFHADSLLLIASWMSARKLVILCLCVAVVRCRMWN